jgi:hypothetical protein
MSHATESELVDAYYGSDAATRAHLAECAECRAEFARLREHLDTLRDYPVPERSASYGAEVWSRLLPHLPPARARRPWFQWWTLAPVLAALLVIAFISGMLLEKRAQAPGISAGARERLLLVALGRHLERSQIVLSEIANGSVSSIDLAEERTRARDLLDDNRLLRQTAARTGDTADANLLDDLERVLLDVANSPADMAARDFEALQSRIDNEGLLFKVRIASSDARFRGQKL